MALKDALASKMQNSFPAILEKASRLPFVHVDRAEFLTKNLSRVCTPAQLQIALERGTLHADIPIGVLDMLAKNIIKAETLRVTAISAAAGIPGGFAMLGTIPADVAQFYGHVLRVAQQLAYLYGWKELSNLDAATESQLVLFLGLMSGVQAAKNAVTKLFGEAAAKSVARTVASKALANTWYYPVIKKVLETLGQRLTKEAFGDVVGKAIPVIGGVISGGLTMASFAPMANKLKKHLSQLASMTPTEYESYESRIIIDAGGEEQ